eukprot:5845030-Pleurochrysis_carterae.AAC.3
MSQSWPTVSPLELCPTLRPALRVSALNGEGVEADRMEMTPVRVLLTADCSEEKEQAAVACGRTIRIALQAAKPPESRLQASSHRFANESASPPDPGLDCRWQSTARMSRGTIRWQESGEALISC